MFDLIRDNNLFTDVQDQALLLLEFDQELVKKRKEAGEVVERRSPAIKLLVDHTYSIPVSKPITRRCLFLDLHVLVGCACRSAAPQPPLLPLFIP